MPTSVIRRSKALTTLIRKRTKLSKRFHEAIKESEKTMHRGHILILGYDKTNGGLLLNFFNDEVSFLKQKGRIKKVFEDDFWVYFSDRNKKGVCHNYDIAMLIAAATLDEEGVEDALDKEDRTRPWYTPVNNPNHLVDTIYYQDDKEILKLSQLL